MPTDDHAIHVERYLDVLHLSFTSSSKLVSLVKKLPYAYFDGASRKWTVPIGLQSLSALTDLFVAGLLGPEPKSLVLPREASISLPPASIEPADTDGYAYRLRVQFRHEALEAQVRRIKGLKKDRSSILMPRAAKQDLIAIHNAGLLSDRHELLREVPHAQIWFDTNTGNFEVFGDPRAADAFESYFPRVDVAAKWKEHGVEVAFKDKMSEQCYFGELARVGPGYQPEGLKLKLYPFQATNVAMALARQGLLIADTMGLGKTISAVAFGHELVNNRKEVSRVIVICPAGLRSHWGREITRFTGNTDVVVVDGASAGSSKRATLYGAGHSARWVVVNYDVLSRDEALLTPLMVGAAVVFDEAHKVKNYAAQRSKAAKRLAYVATRRLALTGTPVENSPDEWYEVIDLAVPGALGKATTFRERYMFRNRWNGFEGVQRKRLPELASRSRAHVVRHTKASVAAHLPSLTVQHVALPTDRDLSAALAKAHKDARDEIAASMRYRTKPAEDPETDEDAAQMTAVGMLRALCSSPRLLERSMSPAAKAMVAAGLVPPVDGPKLDELRVMCAELQAVGERIVVFSWSRRMIDLVAERLSEDGISWVRYTGQENRAQRDAAEVAFNDPNSAVVAFLATDAAAEGLNLGKQCGLLVNLDLPYTPTRLEQRSNRIHRIDGTRASYRVVNMTLKNTVEERLLKLLKSKADLADVLLEEQGGQQRTTGVSTAFSARDLFFEALKGL